MFYLQVKGLEKETRTYVKVATVEDQDGEPKEAIVQIVGSFASSQVRYQIHS